MMLQTRQTTPPPQIVNTGWPSLVRVWVSGHGERDNTESDHNHIAKIDEKQNKATLLIGLRYNVS